MLFLLKKEKKILKIKKTLFFENDLLFKIKEQLTERNRKKIRY